MDARFALPHGTIADVAWKTEESRRNVATRALVWDRSGEDRAKVYAFGGWGRSKAVSEHRRARPARRRYRERFGIETSYRQKNRGRAWTTGTKAEYRFLLEALGRVLRQLWALLTQAIARTRLDGMGGRVDDGGRAGPDRRRARGAVPRGAGHRTEKPADRVRSVT